MSLDLNLPPILPMSTPPRIGGGNFDKPRTSIHQPPTLPPSRPGMPEQRDPYHDDYAARRAMVRAAKAQGKIAATKPSSPAASEYDITVGTGTAFKKKGFGGLDKTMSKDVRQHRGTLGNISKKDVAFFDDMVSKHARHLPTGAGFSPTLKKSMKQEIEHARQAGTISKEDASDFKRMIDHLHIK